MNRWLVPSTAAVLLAVLLAACNLAAQSAGPATWIDQPLAGSRLPIGPITIQAHASDADGAASIEFFVDDGLVASVPTDGSRLGEASVEWIPPGPGTYTVSARAADSSGNQGAMVTIEIVVGEPTTPPSTPTPAPAVGTLPTTPTPSPAIAPTPSPTPSGPMLVVAQNANCRLGPSTQFGVAASLPAGTSVAIEGRDSGSQWFWVRPRSGATPCWVSTTVGSASGNWRAVPVVATPEIPRTATPTPATADTTPPSIDGVSIDPTTVQKQGCGGQETFLIQADVSDASGVAIVTYELSGPAPGEHFDGSLLPAGGTAFQQVVGPIDGTQGTWSITLWAEDAAGNANEGGPWSIQLVCIQ